MDNDPQNLYQAPQPNQFSQPPQFQPQVDHPHKKIARILIIALVAMTIVALVLAALLITKKDNSKQIAKDVVEELTKPVEETDEEANDTERKTDINALHGQLEAFQAQNGYYPTLANVNDSAWRSQNMKGLDDEALKDPQGTAIKLVNSPVTKSYSYEAAPAGCDNGDNGQCTSYTLTATLEAGGTYVKEALN